MAVYYVAQKAEKTLLAIFSDAWLEIACHYKRAQVQSGAFTEDQISISTSDKNGNLIQF